MQINNLTLSQTTDFRLFHLKEFADNNVEFDKNGGNFPEGKKKLLGKREIAFYKQFLLFLQSFQKTFSANK